MPTPESETNHLPPPNSQVAAKRVLINLTVALFITSFILSVVSITSSSWATVSNYSGPNSAARTFIGTSTRGPFKYCLLRPKENVSDTSIDPADFYQDCSAPKCTTSEPNYDNEFFCQQLKVSGNLMIAGTTFVGLAMLMTFPVTVFMTAAAAKPGKHPRPATPAPPYFILSIPHTFYSVIIVLGFVLLAAGNLIGAQVLVNEQPDDADFISSIGGTQSVTDHWLIGQGVWLAFGAWILGLIATVVLNEVTILPWSNNAETERLLEPRNEV